MTNRHRSKNECRDVAVLRLYKDLDNVYLISLLCLMTNDGISQQMCKLEAH